jgi:hypothetical protein
LLKRKRDDDEDNEDLYGNSDTAKRKPREDLEDGKTMGFAAQTNGSTTTLNDETEWLMFLVSEKGELQVVAPVRDLC